MAVHRLVLRTAVVSLLLLAKFGPQPRAAGAAAMQALRERGAPAAAAAVHLPEVERRG
jgi:hypothetical protein